jgi:hypothetical protein
VKRPGSGSYSTVDQAERLFGDVLGGRGDDGDALAPVAHAVVEDVLVAGDRRRARMRRAGVQHARHVLVRQHRLHAGQRERLRGVDALDLRVRDLRAQRLAVQQADVAHVGDVARVAGHLGGQVGALDAGADDRRRGGRHRGLEVERHRIARGHAASACSSRAVISIASMIFV